MKLDGLPLRAAINRSADSAFTSDQHMAHVWYWHKADVPLALMNVRYRG